MNKFWNFIRNEDGERILRLEGPVDEDNFWGDEVTPAMFRDELEAEEGDVTVWINSPGGNVFAAAQIYTMLRDHKGKITVKIDAIAASAASVIAMAGDRVLMSPVAMLMVHDPMTFAMGNAKDMEKAISTLNEVKESIINAYREKTGLSRNRISQLMENETWMNARKAVDLGFADEILFDRKADETDETKEKDDGKEIEAVWQPYSTKAMGQRVLNWLLPAAAEHAVTEEEPVGACCDEADVEQAGETVAVGAEAEPVAEAEEQTTQAVSDAATDTVDEVKPEPVAETVPEPVAEAETESQITDKIKDKDKSDEDEENESDEDESEPDDPVGSDPEDPDEEEDDDPKKPPSSGDSAADPPVIGMDGRSKDGAMPFELLIKQLDFLR